MRRWLLLLFLLCGTRATAVTTGCLLRQSCNTSSTTTSIASTNAASTTSSTSAATTGGVTTTGTAAAVPCPLPEPAVPANVTLLCVSGSWVSPGNVVGTVSIGAGTELVVDGNYTGADLTLGPGSVVTVAGYASLNGSSVTLQLTQIPAPQSTVLIVQASNVTGTPSSVRVIGPFGCTAVSGTATKSSDSTQLGVLLSVNSDGCDHSAPTAALVGGCVGGVLGCALILGLAIFALYKFGYIRRGSLLCNEADEEA